MPFAQVGVRSRQLVMSGIKKVFEHPKEIEVDKTRALVEQERLVDQHFLERNKTLSQLLQHGFFVGAPLVNATAAELSFFMAKKTQPVGSGNQLTPVDVVELEANPFDFAFDIAPKNGLNAVKFPREEGEIEFRINVFRDDLRFFADLEDDRFAVANNRNAIISFAAEAPHQRAIAIWDVRNLESSFGKLENPALHDAEGAPRKLNQLNHVVPPECPT